MNFKHILLCMLLLVLLYATASASGRQTFQAVEVAQSASAASVVTWKGGRDNRWGNPANWEGGRVPGESDVARFATGSGADCVADADSSGALAGLMLEQGYKGTVRLGRDLTVRDEVLVAGGTIDAGDGRLSVGRYRQTGGRFAGDGGVLLIRREAVVTGGTLITGRMMSVESLTIETPGAVTMAANSKLELTGGGEPLRGGGLLDVTTNRPNSVEYTGRAAADLTAAAPVRGALGNSSSDVRHTRPDAEGLTPQALTAAASSSLGRVGALTLTAQEDYPFAAVIDAANGFAYYGTLTSPGIVVKIRLSDFKRVGALVLNTGENEFRCAVIDTANGFAYFGTLTAPGVVVKVRLSDFTRAGALTLDNEVGLLPAAVIDTANGFAYFGTYTGPGSVVKVRLSDFTRVGAVVFNPGEDGILSGVIDTAAGFAYFGTDNGMVVKVRLSDFTRVGAVTLDVQGAPLTCAVIDAAAGFAYFGSFDNFGIVSKVRLSDLALVGTLPLNSGELFLRSAVIDTAGGYAYFGTGSLPGIVVKIRLSDFSRVGALTLNPSNEGDLLSAVIDTAAGFAYFATNDTPAIIKVRLSDFTRAAAEPLSPGENSLAAAVADTNKGFAYFGTFTGIIVKVRMSDLSRVGILSLNSSEYDIRSAVIDTANGFAYFGTDTTPGKVIKVNLSDFTRAGALTLNAGEDELRTAVIDTGGGFAYFSASSFPKGRIVKLRLSDFTRVGALTLGDNERGFCAVLDSAHGFAYFGTPTIPASVVKVQLSDFTRVGALTLNNESEALSAVIDEGSGFAYFGSYNGSVAKVRLSDFTRVAGLTLNSGEENLQSATVDTANGFAYFGSFTQPGRVAAVRLSDFTRVDGITLNAAESYLSSAVVDPASRSAYFGTGTNPGIVVKLALPEAIPTPTPTPGVVQFGSAAYAVNEGDGSATVTVTRTGDTTAAATVSYATLDASASGRADYNAASGTLDFASGETSKSLTVFVADDAFVEGDETFNVTLGSPTNATLGAQVSTVVTIVDNDTTVATTNPLDAAQFFVRRHYVDFLNREPDAAGLAFWTNEIEKCGADAQCREVKRINVSAAFFLSIEFQETGYLVERMYKAAYGDATGTSTFPAAHQLSVPVVRLNEFLADTQKIGRNVVVGQGDWQTKLEADKSAFALEFVQRGRFASAFPAAMTADQFVTKLDRNAGGVLTAAERTQLVGIFGGAGAPSSDGAKRAQVFRAVAENPTLNANEFDRAFVLMQFYGYLRRNPDDAPDADYTGYDFWLSKLDQFRGNFIQAEMVRAFISSDEYRHRFGR